MSLRALAVMALVLPLAVEAVAKECPLPGTQAPPLAVPLADGQQIMSLRAALDRGKPVVLSFWAYWCKPCEKELVLLQRLADEWSEELTLLLLHVGPDEAKMREKLAALGVSLLSGADDTLMKQERYCVTELPATFVINSAGVVMSRLEKLPLEQFERAIVEALSSLRRASADRL